MILQIESHNISKEYDSVQALHQVSINAFAGQIVCIVGVNGSGKTTLLRILAGLDTPNSGRVVVLGRELGLPELRKRSTMVFQKSVMFGGSVYDNVAYGLRINHVPRNSIRSRVTASMRRVNLEGFEKRKARQLSGGEQQRVALARALALERDALLVDEPTANLDPANGMIIEQVIKESKKSSAVVISTNNLPQARRLADRMIHLHRGQVVEEANVTEFFASPRDERTKLFISGELQF